MKYPKFLFLFLTCVLISSCKVKPKPVLELQPVNPVFQNFVDSIYSNNPNAIGILVHVEAPDQNISWSGAAGYSDKINKTKLNPQQPALIASNVKTHVAAAILVLEEQGKLTIRDPIGKLISSKSRNALLEDGYQPDSISVANLLSHTSGIYNYANTEYIEFHNKFPNYKWTRDAQIALSMEKGDPLGKANHTFEYADVNYLLLTEIIENRTGERFYTAIRNLINFQSLGLNDTWWWTLESQPKHTNPMVHQYYGKYNWDSYDQDQSWDLYGGGGIACNTKDLALFSQAYFEGKIVKNPTIRNQILTEMKTNYEIAAPYYLGIMSSEIEGLKAYGHGGFWGTVVQYIPDLNASIAVYVLDRDENKLRKNLLDGMVNLLKEEASTNQ